MLSLYIVLACVALIAFLIWRLGEKTKAAEREKSSRKIAETILKNVAAANEAEVDSKEISTSEKRKRLLDRAGD